MKKITTLLFTLAFCTTAFAEDQAFVTHGGWEHTASSAYEDSWTGSVRYEHRLYRELWVAPEYTYHGPMEHHTGEDDSPFNYGDVSGHSVLVDLIYYPEWARIKKVEPYLIGGAGWSFWEFKESQQVSDLGVSVALGDSFVYKVGVGSTYQISPRCELIIEWSFFKSDVPKTATNADGSESILLGDDNKHGHITIGEEETRLTAGLRFSW